MKQSFEDYLKDVHIEDNPQILDDELPDAYDNWVSDLGVDLLVAYAEKWCVLQKISDQSC